MEQGVSCCTIQVRRSVAFLSCSLFFFPIQVQLYITKSKEKHILTSERIGSNNLFKLFQFLAPVIFQRELFIASFLVFPCTFLNLTDNFWVFCYLITCFSPCLGYFISSLHFLPLFCRCRWINIAKLSLPSHSYLHLKTSNSVLLGDWKDQQLMETRINTRDLRGFSYLCRTTDSLLRLNFPYFIFFPLKALSLCYNLIIFI